VTQVWGNKVMEDAFDMWWCWKILVLG